METGNFPYEVYDSDRVECALEHLPCQSYIDALANFYKLMGDPTRLRLLMALETGELCASDLANVTNMSRSAVSHQLKTLRDSSLSGQDGMEKPFFTNWMTSISIRCSRWRSNILKKIITNKR